MTESAEREGLRSDTARDVEGYLAPGEAARMLGVSSTWVKKLVEQGKLEGIETHLGWLVRPASVEKLVAKRLGAAERKLEDMMTARKKGKGSMSRYCSRGRNCIAYSEHDYPALLAAGEFRQCSRCRNRQRS